MEKAEGSSIIVIAQLKKVTYLDEKYTTTKNSGQDKIKGDKKNCMENNLYCSVHPVTKGY